MRRLLPRWLYPGRERVGAQLSALRYKDDIDVFDGVDWYWGFGLFRALQFFRRHRPEVLVLQWWTGTVLHSYLILAALARLQGVRVFLEFHESLDTAEAQLPLAAQYVKRCIRPLLRSAAGYVVHSEFDRQTLTDQFRISHKPVIVVPHGPYDHGVKRQHNRPRSRESARPVNLLSFGTIRPYKGVEHLVEAFNRLSQEQAKSFMLTIVGETWEGWNLPAQRISESPHRERITFVNRYVTDVEASSYFDQADVVILPYLRSSASGPLHMAMSHGLPVIVSRVGGLTEAAGRYAGTRFVSPGDPEELREALLELNSDGLGVFDDPSSWEESARLLTQLFLRSMGACEGVGLKAGSS